MDLDRIKEIQEKAIRQCSILPVLKEQHESLDKEFEAAMENIRKERERNAAYQLEADLMTVKLKECEKLEAQEIERLESLQSEQNFCNQLIAKENEEIDNMTLKYEQEMKEIGVLFRSAPLLYEVNTLNKEVEDIRNCASQLNDELAELKKEIEEVKQQFNNREKIRDDGVVTGIDALPEVQADGVQCDNIIAALKSKEKDYEQQIAALNLEIKQANAVKESMLNSS